MEEELLDLECVEVAVVVKSLEDGDIAVGEGAEELRGFFLGEEGAGVLSKITKNDGTTMYGSPSRGKERRFLNSRGLRDGARSLKRKWRRRGRSESGSEVPAFVRTALAAAPMILALVAFKNNGDVLFQAAEVVGADGQLSQSMLLGFVPPIP